MEGQGQVEGLRVKCTFIKNHLNHDHVHHKSQRDRTKHDSGGNNNVVRICVKASAADRNTSLQQNFTRLMRAGFRVKSSFFFGGDESGFDEMVSDGKQQFRVVAFPSI